MSYKALLGGLCSGYMALAPVPRWCRARGNNSVRGGGAGCGVGGGMIISVSSASIGLASVMLPQVHQALLLQRLVTTVNM